MARKFRFAMLILAIVSMLAVFGCNDGSDVPVESKLKVVHMNDTHSHLDSESLNLSFDGGTTTTTVQVGGIAKAAAVIKSLIAGDSSHLLLHAGDAVQGSLYYTLFQGQADADVLNEIGFDAMAIGNHEFDDGDSFLSSFIGMLNFPVISSNVVPKEGNVLEGKFAPYIIKTVNGVEYGIIGLTVSGKTQDSSNPSNDITFLDEVESVKKYVEELKGRGIGKIVLLSHYGLEKDKALATQVSEIDIIIGGDSHSLMGDYAYAGLDASESYPYRTVNKDGDTVCIAHAWEYSKVVGELDIVFANNKVSSCSGTPHLVISDSMTRAASISDTEKQEILDLIETHGGNITIATDDTAVAAVVSTYSGQVTALKQTVIGTAGEDMLHNRVPEHAYSGATLPLGSDIAPIVAKAFYDLSNRADVCIQNAGGVRVSVYTGNITIDTAYTLLPFANTLYEIEMYGSEIKQVLEDAVEAIAQGGSDGGFPYSYALRYDVDATQAYGSRFSNLEVKDRTTGTWSAIEDNTMYVVVTNSYTAGGKDGYTTFGTVQDERGLGVNTYLDYAMSFVAYVEAKTAAGQSVTKLPSSDHPIKSYISTPSGTDKL